MRTYKFKDLVKNSKENFTAKWFMVKFVYSFRVTGDLKLQMQNE